MLETIIAALERPPSSLSFMLSKDRVVGSFWDFLDTALDYRAAAIIAVGARLAQPAVQLITMTDNDVGHPARCQPNDGQDQQHE